MDKLIETMKQHFNGTWEPVESDDVFQLILMRLPVKNVLMFKSVAKYWRDVLSTKVYKLLHLIWSMEQPKFLVTYDADKLDDHKVCSMHLMEHNGVYSESYFLPEFETIDAPRIIASFNGLICCVNDVRKLSETYEVDIRICNPATREVVLLPRGHSSRKMPIFGVMHSDKGLFYKIFKFFSDPFDVENGYTQCEVYSSVTGSWHELGRVDILNRKRTLSGKHVCVDEKLYWFVVEENGNMGRSILMVDIEQNFKEIFSPPVYRVNFMLEFEGLFSYVEWKGSNMVMFSYSGMQNSWVMLRFPIFPVSWSKVSHFDSVTAIGADILVVYTDVSGSRHKKLCDLQSKTWRDFCMPEDDKDQAIVVFPFYETLLPCSGNIGTLNQEETSAVAIDEEDDLPDENEDVTDEEEDDVPNESEDSRKVVVVCLVR